MKLERIQRTARVALLVAFSAAGCGEDASVEQPAAAVTTVPATCAAHPTFEAARTKAYEDFGELVGERLDARVTHLPVVTVASQLGRADLIDDTIATLVRDHASFIEQLNDTFAFPIDPTKESVLVMSYVRSESSIELRRAGDVVHAYVARTRPCLDERSAEEVARAGREVLVAAVPAEIASVELHGSEATFAPVLPTAASDACTREGVVFGGGGRAGLLAGTPNTLFVEGFSAMTGNVFATTSTDVATWTPSGWADDALLSFDERGPYADVYSPSPIRIGSTLFLYASTIPRAGALTAPRRLTRFAQSEGTHFARGEDVLLPAESGWDDGGLGSPAVIERAGNVWMYYAGGARDSELRRIGLATSSDGGKTFVREGDRPLIGPETFPYPVSSVADPDVHVVGDRFEMWCTIWLSGGDPNARLTSAIAHLASDDGRTWTADAEPLVVPRGDAERGGLVAPAALIGPSSVTLFATAINERFEPVVERLVCPKR